MQSLGDNYHQDWLGLSQLGLDSAQFNKLFGSLYYKRFEVARCQAAHAAAKSSVLPSEKRLALITMLRKGPCGSDAADLEFAETVLRTSGIALIKYLLETEGAFQTLGEWFPNHEHQLLEHLTIAKAPSTRKCTAPVFLKALFAAVHNGALDDSIPNQVVKGLV